MWLFKSVFLSERAIDLLHLCITKTEGLKRACFCFPTSAGIISINQKYYLLLSLHCVTREPGIVV